ncbi:hypothetical protein [Granulicella sp. dw_53]|uniref:hypothetical protein n=1 Tax=Granulicella sp. dw_53 TaxID=2719792 RepID=UPI001BD2C934|nr:hypothetical protein [Granulicella sp. dw_53]
MLATARGTQLSTTSVKLAMRRDAERLAAAGRHLEASEVLEKLAARSPRNPLIWNDLGVQYRAAGRMDEAFVALRRAHAVDSSYPPTLYNLGRFTLDRAVSLREGGVSAEVEVQGMLMEAIGYLNANLDRDPENVDGHRCIAFAYRMRRDERMAEAHMVVAVRLLEAGARSA